MARAQKLKVYRTPIGFHDAYVAAPSQKAALEAWGSDANLFSRGAAEIVTDEELSREPLAQPGKVIRRLRGSAQDHFEALPKDDAKKAPRGRKAPTGAPSGSRKGLAAVRVGKPPRPKPRPSRKALDAAQKALDDLLARHREEVDDLQRRIYDLARERSELDRAHERSRDAAERAVEAQRKTHSEALARWLGEQDED